MEPSTPSNGESLSPSLDALHNRLLDELQVDTRTAADTLFNPNDRVSLPFQLGRFLLLEQLGEGGQGIVYRAYDPNKATTVAIKVLNTTGQLWDNIRRARFRREAELTSRINDPNVAPVLEASQVDGVSYLVMPYCPGPSLANWLRSRNGRPVPIADAVKLIGALTNAIQACHARGVLHRDLKPANILLFPKADTTPSDAELNKYEPRVCDFGLSRAEDTGEAITRSHTVLGTRAYMAPEQAEGKLDEVGISTDIWALGVILYELLTGQLPFGDDGQTLIRIMVGEPVQPRQLRLAIHKDLEAIVLKCLSRKISDRYGMAAALAEDLDRFRKSEPTVARPLGWAGHVQRWVRRKPFIAAIVLASIIILGLALAGVFFHLQTLEEVNTKLNHALDDSQRNELKAMRRNYEQEIRRCAELLRTGDEPAVYAHLQGLRPAPGQYDLRDFAWRHLAWRFGGSRYTPQVLKSTSALAFSADGSFFATVTDTGQIRLWDSSSATFITELPFPFSATVPKGNTFCQLIVSPQNRWLLASMIVADSGKSRLVLARWDLHRPQDQPRVLDIGWCSDQSKQTHFMEDGRTLIFPLHTLDKQNLDQKSFELIAIDVESFCIKNRQAISAGSLFDLTMDPDGVSCWALTITPTPTFTTTNYHFMITRINLTNTQPPHTETIRTELLDRLFTAAYNPYHHRLTLVQATSGKAVVAEYVQNQKEPLWVYPWTYCPELISYTKLHYSDNGQDIHVCDYYETRRSLPVAAVLRSGTGEVLFQYAAPKGEVVRQFVRHPQTGEYALARSDGFVHLLPASTSKATYASLSTGVQNPPTWSLAFQSDGTLAACGDHGMTRLWNLADRKITKNMTQRDILVSTVIVLPKSTNTLMTGDYHGKVKLWDTKTGECINEWLATTPLKIRSLAASMDGNWVVAGGKSEKIWILNRAQDTTLLREHGHPDSIRALAFLDNHLFSGCEGGMLRACDIFSGKQIWATTGPEEIWCMKAIAAPANCLVTGNRLGDLNWYDPKNGANIRSVNKAHPGGVQALALCPDSTIMASAGEDNHIKIWDLISGEELLTLTGHVKPVYALAFSPDGRCLVSGDTGGQILLWPTSSELWTK